MSATLSRGGWARIWLLNLVANAALLAVVYYWLLIPDAHGWQVGGSALLALAAVVLTLWLRAGTLAYFRVGEYRRDGTVWQAYRHSARHIGALFLWLLVILALLFAVLELLPFAPQFGVWFWQKSPETLRFGNPRQIMHSAIWILRLLLFVAIPAVWVPIAMTVAASGFSRGMWRSLRVLKQAMYWMWFAVLVAIGVYVPYRLVTWVPDAATLKSQAWSMGLRFLAAYVVGLTIALALVCMVGEKVDKSVASG